MKLIGRIKSKEKTKKVLRVEICMLLSMIMISSTACSSKKNSDEESSEVTSVTKTETISETETIEETSEIEDDETEVTEVDASEITKFDIAVEYSDEELTEEYDEKDAVKIQLLSEKVSCDSSDVDISGTTITIKAGGTYVVSGSLSDGNIIVDSKDKNFVRIVLDNADITSNSTAAIFVKNAKETILTLKKGTTNSLADGNEYTNNDEESNEPNAVVFSKDDFVINGSGILNINARYNHGIQSKDLLKIISGNIIIDSVGDGIVGKDGVIFKSPEITISSDADGIKSSKTAQNLGYIYMENPVLNISAVNDGIQAATCMYLNGGTFRISTGTKDNDTSSNNEKISSESDETSDSSKGLKAYVDITIANGTYELNTADDSVHSNNSVTINSGTLDLFSEDDGIHADSGITINNGTINIMKSYEGIESKLIAVNDGNISLIADDDGFNAGGGNDQSSMNGRPGQNSFASSGDNKFIINGGKIYVNASGDGLDSNGSISMNGGEVYVDGPTDSGNGAIDYDSSFDINGGVLVAVGSIGMATAPTSESTQYSVNEGLSSSYQAGTCITVKDSSGNIVISYTPSKTFQSFVFSTAGLNVDENYTIYANDVKDSEFTISSVTTNVGNTGGMNGGMVGRPGKR